METLLDDLAQAVRNGKAKQAKNLIEEAVARKIPVERIVNGGLMKAMAYLTETMENASAFVPEVILASRAMDVATAVLEERLGEEQALRPRLGTAVAATVRGDLHEIGLNLVCMMLKNIGFEVYNLGCDVSADELIAKAEETGADIICLSAMLTTTMPQIQRVIKLLENRGIRQNYIVMVGGAPVTERYAQRIGADIYTSDAVEAADRAKTIMEKKRRGET